MFRPIVAICFFLAVASATKININQCGGDGKVSNIDVTPCDADPCVFKPNMDVTVTGTIVPTVASDKPTISVQVKVAGFFVEYPGISKDACEYVACPLKANEEKVFKISLKTLDWLPPMDTSMQFHVYESEGGAEIACAEASVSIAA